MSDPQKYRTKEELEQYQKTDPVERMKQYLLEEKVAKQKDIDAIQERIEEDVLEAVKFADESPFPEADALYEDMFAGTPFIHDKK